MAFSRNSLAAAVAGTLSLAVLTGCPAAAPTTPGTPTAAPGTPTAAPGATAAPTTAPGATVAPSATPSASPLEKTTLRGKVYDLDNAAVGSGAKVTVKSLNPSSPFESTVDVLSGSYVVNGVPAGVQLEITAARDGWTQRTRVETLLPLTSSQPNIVNFGGPYADDAEGAAYFISKYPEITSVEPADKAENVDPTKLVYKLTLSEPLDVDNQNLFKNAIRILPANTQAAANGTTFVDLTATAARGQNVDGGAFAYVIKDGSTFLDTNAAANRATVTWDAAGQVATLTFNAPLQTNETTAARYQAALVSPVGTTTMIEDREGNQLGYDGTNAVTATAFPAYPAQGIVLDGTFRETDLSVTVNSGVAVTGFQAWDSTHVRSKYFDVAKDDTDPQLTAVNVVELTGESRIELTFSEPMGVFNGSGAVAKTDTSLGTVTNYTFALAKTAADLGSVELDGTTAAADANPNAQFPATNYKQEFKFTALTQATTLTPSIGQVSISPNDPKVVRITLASNFFPADANAIKARVQGVKDPAGNNITETNADAQVKTGTF